MSFAWKATFVVDHTKVPSTQTDFPVLISFTNANAKTVGNGGQMTSSSGYDFRPYSDAAFTTPLTYQLHYYDGAAGTLVMRVKIASLSSGSDTTIYCGFGDSGITTDGSSASVWDSNYKAYYPLGNSSGLSLTDVVAGHDVTSGVSGSATTGKVDGGESFNGTTQYNSDGEFDGAYWPTSPITVSGWASQNTLSNQFIVGKGVDGATAQFYLGIDGSGGHALFGWNGTQQVIGSTAISTGTLYKFDGTYDGTTYKVYLNGSLDGSLVDSTAASANSADFEIGAIYLNGSVGGFWGGVIDEVSVCTTARSADWILAMYRNENDPSAAGFFNSIVFAANTAGSDNQEWMTKIHHERYRQVTNVAY